MLRIDRQESKGVPTELANRLPVRRTQPSTQARFMYPLDAAGATARTVKFPCLITLSTDAAARNIFCSIWVIRIVIVLLQLTTVILG
jgi:hypothetical protein